jgi:predicted RNA binding protein YcfA (HicA-like mRNA interferase family)
MPRLPIPSGTEIIEGLVRIGFEEIRQKGSHVILKKETPTGEVGCIVLIHKEGALKGILKQASVSIEKFIKVL